ncbi:unnamed protein product [Clavelina lepadiformis]|uniref:Uncharacterized protein n=1 Tax=Clavelina lepadiformis TaxID=159417 RepID=A0ABP0GQH9_CLALP
MKSLLMISFLLLVCQVHGGNLTICDNKFNHTSDRMLHSLACAFINLSPDKVNQGAIKDVDETQIETLWLNEDNKTQVYAEYGNKGVVVAEFSRVCSWIKRTFNHLNVAGEEECIKPHSQWTTQQQQGGCTPHPLNIGCLSSMNGLCGRYLDEHKHLPNKLKTKFPDSLQLDPCALFSPHIRNHIVQFW